jgi:hypothetical protein
MIRYKLNPHESKVVIVDDDLKSIKTIYPDRKDIFVDILGEKEHFRKIRVFLNDEIIVGWILTQFTGLIIFHNEEELLDGRFNSDRVT